MQHKLVRLIVVGALVAAAPTPILQAGGILEWLDITGNVPSPVDRAGAGTVGDAFRELFYQVTARGIDHEHATGRAQLPRSLQLWKDEEEEGYDQLLLANVSDRLTVRFQTQLTIDQMRAVASTGNALLQVADLFTGAVNRIVNPPSPPPQTPGAKDHFARFLLERVGWNPSEGDMAVMLSI